MKTNDRALSDTCQKTYSFSDVGEHDTTARATAPDADAIRAALDNTEAQLAAALIYREVELKGYAVVRERDAIDVLAVRVMERQGTVVIDAAESGLLIVSKPIVVDYCDGCGADLGPDGCGCTAEEGL